MLAIDYNGAVTKQYDDLEKNKLLIAAPDLQYSGILFEQTITSFNTRVLAPQLLFSKGLAADLREKFDATKEQHPADIIDSVQNLINTNVSLHNIIEELGIEKNVNNFPALRLACLICIETIECLYDVLRILKKAEKKISRPISEAARLSAKISARSLEKILYEH